MAPSLPLAYCACALIWGTTWFAVRASIGPDGFPTFASAALRFSIAAALLGAVWLCGLARPGPGSRRTLGWLCIAGLANGGQYALIYLGEERIPGGLAALMFGTAPLWMALGAVVTRTEAVSARRIVGSVISLAGIGLVFGDRLSVSIDQAAGVAMVLCAVVLATVVSIVVKREASAVHPLATTGVFVAVTAAVLWVATIATGGVAMPWPPPPRPTVAMLYLAVFGSLVAFASYFYLIRRGVRLMTLSTLVFVQPVIALAVDAVWEQQIRLTSRSYVGAAVTLAGVLISLSAAKLAGDVRPVHGDGAR